MAFLLFKIRKIILIDDCKHLFFFHENVFVVALNLYISVSLNEYFQNSYLSYAQSRILSPYYSTIFLSKFRFPIRSRANIYKASDSGINKFVWYNKTGYCDNIYNVLICIYILTTRYINSNLLYPLPVQIVYPFSIKIFQKIRNFG